MATETPLSADTPARDPHSPQPDSTLDGNTNPTLDTGSLQRAPTINALLRQSLGLTVDIPQVPQFAPVLDLGGASAYYADCAGTAKEPITSFHVMDFTGCPGSVAHAKMRRHYYTVMLESSGEFGRRDYLEWHENGTCPCFRLQNADDDSDTDTNQPWSWEDDPSHPTSAGEHGVDPFSEFSASFELIDLFSPEEDILSEMSSVQPSGSDISGQDTRLQVLYDEPGPQSPWAMAHPNLCRYCLEKYVREAQRWRPLSSLCCGESPDAEGGGQAVSGPRGHAQSYTGDGGLSSRRCAACNSHHGASSHFTRHIGSAGEVSIFAAVARWVGVVRRYLDI